MTRGLRFGVLALVFPLGIIWGQEVAAQPLKAEQRCFYIVAGRDATADGSVLMAYNNDWEFGNDISIDVVPSKNLPGQQPSTPYLRLFIRSQGLNDRDTGRGYDISEGGINVHQVGAIFGVGTDLAPEVMEADSYCNDGAGWDLWDEVLERSHTVREALDIIEEISQTHGFGWWSAGSMAFADTEEVWIVELLGCRHWVAARVPDDAYYVQSNMLRIREVDLTDRERFRGSPDLEEFAVSIGRYDPSEGPFDVAWAYGDRSELLAYWNTDRLWRAIDLLSPSLEYSVDAPYVDRPVFEVPDYLLTKEDLMMVARDHYEGTDLDLSQDYTLGSPHFIEEMRPICTSYTDYSAVWQIRDSLPDAVGGVIWLAPSHPCSSTYVPFYAGITEVHPAWSDVSDGSAFNGFWNISASLDAEGFVSGDNRFHYYFPFIQETLGAFEEDTFEAQPEIEAFAADLWLTSPEEAESFLTGYAHTRAEAALDLAWDLAGQLP